MALFKKAKKKQAKLRLAIFGPSGSGKTFSSLAIASGLGNKIGLIDTERGSASKYSDIFDFDVAELDDYSIDSYVKTIKAANFQYDVIIVDSLSHAWKWALKEVERITPSFKGNSWSAWSKVTPQQENLVNAILGFGGHIICTMRSKTEWAIEPDARTGKTKPVRLGTSPSQGKDIEYEFDELIELSTDHIATFIKDRTGKFQDKVIEKPGLEIGKELKEWLNTGDEIKADSTKKKSDQYIKYEKSLNKALSIDEIKNDIGPEIRRKFADDQLNSLMEIGKQKIKELEK